MGSEIIFKRIPSLLLQQEKEKIAATNEILRKLWEKEIECYELGSKQETTHPATLDILNPRLFPYDKSCYFLLDMYLCMEGDFMYKLPCYIGEFARRDDENILEECYMPNSAYAIWSSLVPSYRAATTAERFIDIERQLIQDCMNKKTVWISSHENPLGSDFSFLRKWDLELREINNKWFQRDAFNDEKAFKGEVENIQSQFSITRFEDLSKGQRTKILLKLLKHGMSELQRDHRLARAVLLCMIEHMCFCGNTGTEAFRYFLLTVNSEFIFDCDEGCQDRDEDDESTSDLNHICADLQQFISTISKVLQFGIRHFTKDHAVILSAFISDLFTRSGWKEVEDLHEICVWDDESYTMAKDTPLDLTTALLEGLARLNFQFRHRIVKLLNKKYKNEKCDAMLDDDLDMTVESHINCTNALISIGEIVLKSCPATPVTESIGSIIASGLAISTITPFKDHNWYRFGVVAGKYMGQHCHLDSILNPLRYSDRISNACNNIKKRTRIFEEILGLGESDNIRNDPIIQQIFLATNHTHVVKVVRGLFLRQLVETNECGFGYGDFQLWSQSYVSPLDDLIYEHNMNFPNKTGYDEERLLDSNDNTPYSVDELKALHDLSLLFLRNAWNEPWTASSHLSFQKPFRDAVKTIALIGYRHNFPIDLCVHINSFLSRDWWPDENARCWCYDCQIAELKYYLDSDHSDMHHETSSKKLLKCNGCKIAHACSKKHMKEVFIEGHLRLCNCPPMRVPTTEDRDICEWYIDNRDKKDKNIDVINIESMINTMSLTTDTDDVINDDEDEWESVSSSEEVPNTVKSTILQYFETKSYAIQRREREEHAFAAHF